MKSIVAIFANYRKAWAESAQSFALWQQATIEIMRMRRDNSIVACSRHLYMVAVLRAHPVRGESHIQRNANAEVATLLISATVLNFLSLRMRTPFTATETAAAPFALSPFFFIEKLDLVAS